MDSKQTHYETLSIARSAPDFLIRAAFKSLSQKYHPDVNPNDEDSHSKMVAINYAYQTLSDEGKRKAYDLWLDRQSSPSNLEPKGDSNRNSPFDQPLKSRRRRPSIWSFAGTLVSFVCLVFLTIFYQFLSVSYISFILIGTKCIIYFYIYVYLYKLLMLYSLYKLEQLN